MADKPSGSQSVCLFTNPPLFFLALALPIKRHLGQKYTEKLNDFSNAATTPNLLQC